MRVSGQPSADVLDSSRCAAARKLELYSADANPVTNADVLLSNFIPVSEDALGAPNNQVGAGLFFPAINTY